MLNKISMLLLLLLIGCTAPQVTPTLHIAATPSATATALPTPTAEPSLTPSITPTATDEYPKIMTPDTKAWSTNVLSNACNKIAIIFISMRTGFLWVRFPNVYDACIAKGVIP